MLPVFWDSISFHNMTFPDTTAMHICINVLKSCFIFCPIKMFPFCKSKFLKYFKCSSSLNINSNKEHLKNISSCLSNLPMKYAQVTNNYFFSSLRSSLWKLYFGCISILEGTGAGCIFGPHLHHWNIILFKLCFHCHNAFHLLLTVIAKELLCWVRPDDHLVQSSSMSSSSYSRGNGRNTRCRCRIKWHN